MPKLAIKSNVLMHSNKNRFVSIFPTAHKVRGYLGRMELPAKVILAWGEAIGGHAGLRTWLAENGYPELALFTHALRNQREARDWLMANGHPHLMAIVRGAEGEEAAVSWLRLHGMRTAADIALAADNDDDALGRLLAAGEREWAGLALKIRHVKNGIERDNNDVHRISAN
jgi:hypothetical protein